MASKKQNNQVRESIIQKQILDYLKMRKDLVCWRNQNIGIYDPKIKKFRSSNSIPGASDIFGVWKSTGQFIAIEVKSEIGRLSDNQRNFLKMISDCNGIAIVARSLEDVIKGLDHYAGPREKDLSINN